VERTISGVPFRGAAHLHLRLENSVQGGYKSHHFAVLVREAAHLHRVSRALELALRLFTHADELLASTTRGYDGLGSPLRVWGGRFRVSTEPKVEHGAQGRVSRNSKVSCMVRSPAIQTFRDDMKGRITSS